MKWPLRIGLCKGNRYNLINDFRPFSVILQTCNFYHQVRFTDTSSSGNTSIFRFLTEIQIIQICGVNMVI